jgi:alkanesulfonate monooxygenase SsuD/methylene tetrahydromethanopterin reductase-like flavin-dependent oxidoreductase (luciferase family)
VALASRVASLDRVSGGRLLFGVGVGYLAPELAAFGVPPAGRGRRADEALDAVAALWRGETAFAGEAVAFRDVRAAPGPLTPGGPPLHVGGHSPAALRRAAARARGWYGWMLTPEATSPLVAALHRACADHARPPALGPIEVTVTPPPGTTLDAPTVAAYAAAGTDRLVLLPPRPARDDTAALIRLAESGPPPGAG